MSADEVRARCGTSGPVRLFTSPWSFGYVQNPISVYYCYSGGGPDDDDDEDGAGGGGAGGGDGGRRCSQETLETCVAEVTNTPWGERVAGACIHSLIRSTFERALN